MQLLILRTIVDLIVRLYLILPALPYLRSCIHTWTSFHEFTQEFFSVNQDHAESNLFEKGCNILKPEQTGAMQATSKASPAILESCQCCCEVAVRLKKSPRSPVSGISHSQRHRDGDRCNRQEVSLVQCTRVVLQLGQRQPPGTKAHTWHRFRGMNYISKVTV